LKLFWIFNARRIDPHSVVGRNDDQGRNFLRSAQKITFSSGSKQNPINPGCFMDTLEVRNVKPSDLPKEWVKKLPKGQTYRVTIRPETVSEPVQRPKNNEEAADSLFGIWKDNPAVQDVDGFVRGLRGSLASDPFQEKNI
jgi:hypothetical protein